MPSDIKNKIIISDTSCLIALTNIKLLNILKDMFETILITPEVASEFEESLPEWILVKHVNDTEKTKTYSKFLDIGESSAIALAMEFDDALLIVDDMEARQFALNLGLKITGTLGILILANKKGFIDDLPMVIFQLKEIGFHLPPNTDELITGSQ